MLYSCVLVDLLFIDRIAAEQRITDLQNLVDETFQQFALDDSEDDCDSSSSIDFSIPHGRGSHPVLNFASLDLDFRTPLKTCLSSPLLTKSTGEVGSWK